jgi:hypothetical protein
MPAENAAKRYYIAGTKIKMIELHGGKIYKEIF